MKKKLLSLLMASTIGLGLLTGCGSTNSDSAAGSAKIGMVTDSGTIDDKSFNQGSWEGIQRSKDELGTDIKYLKPDGTTIADYSTKIKDLYDGGYKFIVTPGFKFEGAIFEAQDKYKDAKFVLIDGVPNNGKSGDENVSKIGENTVAVSYAEHEAGFMAGVAAALELKEGDLGFLGGMEASAVQKFNWGFQQGVAYANETFGTKMTIKEENVQYQGSFDSPEAGQQIAATMFDRGVKAVFAAAGGTGTGAITEAKARQTKGENVWVIGVDSDQYDEGIYADGKSAILTSAMKKIDQTTYSLIKDLVEKNEFPGGQQLVLTASEDCVGLPEKNPNLSADTTAKCDEVFAKIKSGEIKVSSAKGNLIK